MRSPNTALLWSVWQRHRLSVWAIAGMTMAAWGMHVSEVAGRAPGAPPDPSPLVVMLGMLSFLLLVGIAGYTDTSGEKELARFPRRLFTLPLSSLRLVALPTLAGIAAVELFYVFWREPLSRGEPGHPLFTALLLAAFVVLLQTVLWTLDRAGALRIVIAGAIGIVLLGVNLLPLLPPTPPPLWRTEGFLGAVVSMVAAAAFGLSWWHIGRLRTGGGEAPRWLDLARDRIADAMPGRRRPFSSAAAAQFWFEWRTSGAVLPALVAGAVVIAIGPISWTARGDGTETMRLLVFSLVTPFMLALPVGMAAAKPRFWSEDLSVPPFLAVRPLAAVDIIATKVKVAAASAVAAWAALLAFIAVWLSLWGNLDRVSEVVAWMRTLQGDSIVRVVSLAALAVAAAVLLTWRLLVCRLASGQSGSRRWFMWSVLAIPLVVVSALMFKASRLLDWLFEDPTRFSLVAWAAAIAVGAKAGFAIYAWRAVPPRYKRVYLGVWFAGTAVFTSLGAAIWWVAFDDTSPAAGPALAAITSMSLLVMPLGRIAFAASRLARNRHR